MRHELFPSIDEMLSPATLSDLTGRSVASVRQMPFHSSDSLSGSRFLAVETDGGPRYIVKRINAAWDWIMRATDDRYGRAVVAWQTGLLDRLPPQVSHEVIACAVDGPGWAILLHDASAALIPPGDDPLSVADNAVLLDAMAALHASFWEEPAAADPQLGFCDLAHHYHEFSPATGQREAGGPDPIPPLIARGWALLEEQVEPEVAGVIRPLLADPQPLCAALRRFPQTVVHGDWKAGNLGVWRSPAPRVVLLDWAVVGPAPPAVDLAWYLAVNSARLPVVKEEAIAVYERALAGRLGARFDQHWWLPQLQLSLLGGFLQLGWPKLLGAAHGETAAVRARERAELAWWSARIRTATPWL